MQRWWVMTCIGLVGCAATALPPPVVMPEPPREPWPVAAEEVMVTVNRPAPLPLIPVSAAEGYTAVASANKQALMRPHRDWFHGAKLVYPPCEDCIFHILTKDQSPTVLVFPPPERVIKINDADDEWFELSLIERETASHPDVVVILPKAPKLKKDVSIVTTKGLYALALESHATHGLVTVQWAHEEPVIVPVPRLPSGLYYANLEIQPVHGSPPWTPVAAWAIPSLGRTLVQYPPAMKRFGMPIIKAIGADGETKETMNWRPKGDYMEIDRFFQVAEVRFGHEDVAVVRIAQTDAMKAIWCPGTAGCPNPELAR